MASPEEFEAANARGAEKLRGPLAVSARYDRRMRRIVIRLNTGLDISFLPGDAQGLEGAMGSDLDEIEVSPSGLGIHFPKLDADLYLPALLPGFLGSEKWPGARGGKVKSEPLGVGLGCNLASRPISGSASRLPVAPGLFAGVSKRDGLC